MMPNFLLLLAIIPAVMGEITEWIFKEKVHYGARPDVKIGARVSAHRMHSVDVYMKLKNIDVLHEVLMNISTPNHPDYGKHWTRNQLNDLIGNPKASHKVVKVLEEHGATVIKRSKFSEYVTMRAPVAVWEHLFSTEFYEFSHPDWGTSKVLRALDYSLPAELHEHIFHVDHVVHFPPVVNGQRVLVDNFKQSKHDVKIGLKNGVKMGGLVTPAFISDYYNISSNIGNSGTSQAIFASLGQHFSPSDLTAFQTFMQLPLQSIAGDIGQPGHIDDAHCLSYPDECSESNLDVQYIMGIAQNVPTYHAYFEGADFIGALENITNMYNPPKVFSISYGGYGFDYYYSYFFNIYAMISGGMGITIVVASGDDGALNFGVRGNASACRYEPSFPAYSPYVLSVGATQGAEWGGVEIACSSSTGGVITSGGGFSPYDMRPQWQDSAVSGYFSIVDSLGLSPVPGYSNGTRGYPDISLIGSNYVVLVADNIYILYGTSASAPAIGGMISLLNSQLAANGWPSLGFINPLLYSELGYFFIRDIEKGKNNCTVGLTCCAEGFSATWGWDPVTGLGVPMFDNWMYLLNNYSSNSSYPIYNYTEPTAVPTWLYYNQSLPTELPTEFPAIYNNTEPTQVPSWLYYNQSEPSSLSTEFPSSVPTGVSTFPVTDAPTIAPSATVRPSTVAPSAVPTRPPTQVPTISPTKSPTRSPTRSPTIVPTARPSANPTIAPSAVPTFTKVPTISPTQRPSSIAPTAPTRSPTIAPTAIPTKTPTYVPTKVPTASPTRVPTKVPTVMPTRIPTATPTFVPTKIPTVMPTRIPTATPTFVPTKIPTVVPTKIPTRQPTFIPTKLPTVTPTKLPTKEPTFHPTKVPTNSPTKLPTRQPTFHPTKVPTNSPTKLPTRQPTFQPTRMPTAQPTMRPTTSAPTHALNEVGQVTCAPFSVSNTLSTTRNFATCRIMACNNYIVQAKMCSEQTVGQATCSGDTFLRVFDSAGVEVASNNDYCGKCSGLTFTATSQCEMYHIREGCNGNTICSGSVVVSYYIPSAPTATPTYIPTFSPTMEPTSNATSATPTFIPTFSPTMEPSSNATFFMTSNMTYIGNYTFTPTIMPTLEASLNSTVFGNITAQH